MPIVQIELLAGRSEEQMRGLVKDVTQAVAQNTGASAENVHVIIREMAQDRYAVGGQLKSDQS